MNFAVVEYSSKSGNIWRSAPNHPNYLEDPEKVIDPTSFGCYVSALAGQHIPLTKFVGADKLSNKIIKRLTGSWPRNYSLEYFKRFDVLMIVYQISDAHEIARLVSRVKQAQPNTFIIGVPTQPYGILKTHLADNPTAKQHFIDYMNRCDVFLTVVKATQSWYESMTSTPVVYLPQIYPTHWATRFFTKHATKEKTIFVAGITDRPKISQGFIVAQALQKEFPDYHINVTQIPGVIMNLDPLRQARYSIAPFQPWLQHLPWLAKQTLVVNTDYTLTRGRVQVDCAAVGTPSLGANSDGQTDLFPELASTPDVSIDKLIELGTRLLTDHAYYEKTVAGAREKLKKYDYEKSAARLQMLVKSYKQ